MLGFFLLFFLKLCLLYCRDKDPKIKKAQLPVEKKGQSVNVVLWVLNTLEEQAEPEPSAQSSAVRPRHKDSGTDYAKAQYSLPGFYFLSPSWSILTFCDMSRTVKTMWVWTSIMSEHVLSVSAGLMAPRHSLQSRDLSTSLITCLTSVFVESTHLFPLNCF